MIRVIVTANEFSKKTAREKVTAIKNTGSGIASASGYFPDGNPTATNSTNAGNDLEAALNIYDANPSDANRDIANDKEKDAGVMMDNAVMYVQGKCNNAPDYDTAAAMAHSAALGVKKAPESQPVPGQVTDADAEYSEIPNTLWVSINKRPKYTKYFEVRISTNPDDPTSWKLWDTFSGRKLLLNSLESGVKYYIKITACNNAGKSIPSAPLEQRAA